MPTFNVGASIGKFIAVFLKLGFLRSTAIYISLIIIALCYPSVRYYSVGSNSPEDTALSVERFQGDGRGAVINSYNDSLRVALGRRGVGGVLIDVPVEEGASAVLLGGCVTPVSLSVADRPFSGVQVRADQLVKGVWREGGSLVLYRDMRARCFRSVAPLEEGVSRVRYRVRFLHASGIVDISEFSVAWLGQGQLSRLFQSFLRCALVLFGGVYVAVWLSKCEYLLYSFGIFLCVAALLLIPGDLVRGVEEVLYLYTSDLLLFDYYLVSHFFIFFLCGFYCYRFLRARSSFEAALDALCFTSISEALQVFSFGREPSFVDLSVDLFGLLLGIVVLKVGAGQGWGWSLVLLFACVFLGVYIAVVSHMVGSFCWPC